MTLRVLVVDGEALVRAGFRMILQAQPDFEVVGEAANGLEAVAVAAARRLRPDVVLMDIRLPRMDGLEATRRLAGRGRRAGPRADPDHLRPGRLRLRGPARGASGFLLKDLPREDLLAVRVVAGGDVLLARR